MGRSRGTTLLGGVRNTAPSLGSRSRFYRTPGGESFFRRLGGDLHRALASGLTPSPDRSWLRTPLLVPSTPLAGASVRGPAKGGRPVFGGPVAKGAYVTRMAIRTPAESRSARPADYRAGSWAQRLQVRLAAGPGRGEPAACPVAAGLGSIYRPSTIREQDHNM
ncbi:hypothetical protein GCM10010289_14380 [Streptomyces violascens]|uniref:Uncharacterized protein n=1 Tax=Streptomyces violascens TaxID=67381 RepID=A0ABQ3QJT2_9ACTN|nr:hypothetical protein GCM10010289_14380 [Streptomyces violascens]GHI37514.1 hypothetical protein Sviol_19220 [Streptomyces violascens]